MTTSHETVNLHFNDYTRVVHPQSYLLPPAWEAAIDGWLNWQAAAGMRPASRRTRRSCLRSVARATGTVRPADATTTNLVDALAVDVSADHRRSLYYALRSFYQWAERSDLVSADPTVGLAACRAVTPTPRPATDAVWAAAAATHDDRVQLMVRLAGEAGLRRAEVAQVHARDLIATPTGADLIVHGKGGKQRVVPITDSLADTVRAHGDGFVFPGKINGHLSADAVGRLVSAAMPTGWSMHKLRHRYATRGYAGTGNLRAVQEALGHASVATTQRYTAVSAADVRAVSEAASSNDAA